MGKQAQRGWVAGPEPYRHNSQLRSWPRMGRAELCLMGLFPSAQTQAYNRHLINANHTGWSLGSPHPTTLLGAGRQLKCFPLTFTESLLCARPWIGGWKTWTPNKSRSLGRSRLEMPTPSAEVGASLWFSHTASTGVCQHRTPHHSPTALS